MRYFGKGLFYFGVSLSGFMVVYLFSLFSLWVFLKDAFLPAVGFFIGFGLMSLGERLEDLDD